MRSVLFKVPKLPVVVATVGFDNLNGIVFRGNAPPFRSGQREKPMKKSVWVRMSAVLLLVGCGSVVGTAEHQPLGQPLNRPLELASPFVDNLVLQRGMKVPVWGWATPGSQVTVAFAGQSKSATADAKGKWMVKLDPLGASAEERELNVTSSRGESITCKGVLAGEVWFASGQSNME
ncbi:MAG: hypothetical protein ACYSU0_16205, partial [Planctomycetota bacterium]